MLIDIQKIEKVKINLIYGYLLFMSLYAPITYYFSSFRFFFSALALFYALLGIFLIKNSKTILILFLFIIYFLISIMNNGLKQSLYGLYIFSFFLFSFTLKKESIVHFFNEKKIFWFFILFINCFAVFYVDKNGSPWIGSSIENFGLERQLSKEWTAGEMIRNPGFSNSSVSIACLILLSYFMSVFNLYRGDKINKNIGILISIILYPLVSYLIFLTTTKTIIFSMIFATFIFLLPLKIIPILSKIILIIMVVFSYLFFFLPGQEYYGRNTLLIRFYDMWPSAFKILDDYISIIFGRGFGSIGTAQNFNNQYQTSNPGDNLLVYLYVTFGIFSLISCLYFIIKFLSKNIRIPNVNARCFYVVFMILIFNCFTYNMVELSVFAIIFGMFIKNSISSYSVSEKYENSTFG